MNPRIVALTTPSVGERVLASVRQAASEVEVVKARDGAELRAALEGRVDAVVLTDELPEVGLSDVRALLELHGSKVPLLVVAPSGAKSACAPFLRRGLPTMSATIG